MSSTQAVMQALLLKKAGGRAGPLGDVPFDSLHADTLRAYAAVACALPPGLAQLSSHAPRCT